MYSIFSSREGTRVGTRQKLGNTICSDLSQIDEDLPCEPNIRGGDASCEVLFHEEVLFSDQHLQSVCKDENFDISDERPFHVEHDM